MTNIQTGFLYDQLNDLEHILLLKSKLFENYDKFLKNLSKKIRKMKKEENTIHSIGCIV